MRIVHFSDLHLRKHLPGSSSIRSRHSRRVPALLEAAVPRVNAIEPDLVVVSGDLLDFPLGERADPRFIALGLADLGLIAEQITRLDSPVIVIPGNHDETSLCWRVLERVTDRSVAGYHVLVFHDGEDASHVPHRLGRERERFERVLSAPDSPQIHVQHYVVWPRLDEGYPHTYADGEQLRQQIVDSGNVRLVVSGHYHLGVTPFRAGDTWFATVPAFCEAPYRLWIYDLDGTELVCREESLEEELWPI